MNPYRVIKYLLASLLFMGLTSEFQFALADVEFGHVEGAPLDLGRGINADAPTLSFQTCVEFSGYKYVELGAGDDSKEAGLPEGVNKIEISSDFVKSHEDMLRKLEIDVSMKGEATFKGISGGGEFKFDGSMEYNSSKTDLMLVHLARYNFGVRRIRDATLKPQFKALLDEKKYDEFINACGTHFVDRELRAAYVALVLKTTDLSQSIQEVLKSSFSSKVEVKGFASAESNFQLSSFFRRASKYGSVKLDFQARGGDPTKAAAFAKAADDVNVDAALDALNGYLQGVKVGTSIPTEYWLASYEPYGLKLPPTYGARRQFIRKAYLASLDIGSALKKMQNELDTLRDAGQVQSVIGQLHQKDIATLRSQQSSLEQLIGKCLGDPEACNDGAIPSVDTNLVWLSDLVSEHELQYTCRYSGDLLSNVTVRLQAALRDIAPATDVRVYRLDIEANRSRMDILRTSFDDDPVHGRFVVRIEDLDAGFPADVTNNPQNRRKSQALRDDAEKARYEMELVTRYNHSQWYDLGKIPMDSAKCPTAK